jgi:hypothetical protein
MHRAWAQGPEEQIRKLIENRFTEYKNGRGGTDKHLDFEKIIPSPDIVRQTESGSSANFGAYLLQVLSGELYYEKKYDEGIGRQAEERADDAIRRFLKENPEYEKFGQAKLQCLEKTGFASWYEWNTHHWGTKWNACEGEIEHVLTHEGVSHMEFTLETAWSVPEPVWTKLAGIFPDVVFEIAAFDEGWVFAAQGIFNGPDDQEGFEFFYPYSKRKRWRDFYEKVYGHEYLLDDGGEQSASSGE